MKISSNELVVTVIKACVGKGVPCGVAEDMGAGCLALAMDGRNPLASIVPALEGYVPDEHSKPIWEVDGSDWCCATLNVLPYGPSVIDFAQLVCGKGAARVSDCDAPNLIWGLAKARGQAFDWNEDSGGISLSIRAEEDAGHAERSTCIDVPDDDWARLGEFAALILVPADDTNRADAGAGLTDND